MDRMNLFNPFNDKENSHEDVLTRNFLIILKLIPSVQTAFFELIRDKMSKRIDLESIAQGKLAITEIYTQVVSNNLLASIQDCKILSVVISDAEYKKDHTVKSSNRNARYDGVVLCDPSWIFIIENKPSVGNIWPEQLNPNCDDAKGNELIEYPCRLSWRNIIEILNAVLKHNVANGIEVTLIGDFLDYINENYPDLNPYNKLGLCKDSKRLLDKRCGDILIEALKDQVENIELKYQKGWKYYIDASSIDTIVPRIALDSDGSYVTLWMFAGETMRSARKLMEKIKLDKVAQLQQQEYVVRPNFHLSYRSKGLVWFPTDKISVIEYVEYWKRQTIKQINRTEIEHYCDDLASESIIKPDMVELRKKITSKQYPMLNVCPSVYFGYRWTLEDAVSLDNDDRLVEECRQKIKQIRSSYE